MTDPTSQDTQDPRDFEGLLKDLAALVERLERGNLPLEESIATYERGVALLGAAQKVLDAAQERLQVLIGPGAEPQTLDPQPFLDGK